MSHDFDDRPPATQIATDVIAEALRIVGGNRQTTHGDKLVNHRNIADLWNGYLGDRLGGTIIDPHDVAVMMILLKVARTKHGALNRDDYVDIAGYAGVACEIMMRDGSEFGENEP
jgi:hypothetical protein